MSTRRPGGAAARWTTAVLVLALALPSVCRALGSCEERNAAHAQACCAESCAKAGEPAEERVPAAPSRQWSCCEARALPATPSEPTFCRQDATPGPGFAPPAPPLSAGAEPLPFRHADPPPPATPLYTLHAALLI